MRHQPIAALAAFSAAILSLLFAAKAQPGGDCTVGREVIACAVAAMIRFSACGSSGS